MAEQTRYSSLAGLRTQRASVLIARGSTARFWFRAITRVHLVVRDRNSSSQRPLGIVNHLETLPIRPTLPSLLPSLFLFSFSPTFNFPPPRGNHAFGSRARNGSTCPFFLWTRICPRDRDRERRSRSEGRGENMFWRNEGGDYATIYRGAKYCAAGIGGNGAKGGGYSVQ